MRNSTLKLINQALSFIYFNRSAETFKYLKKQVQKE